MENKNDELHTIDEVKKMSNYDFSHDGVILYKGEKMSKKQVGEHLEILRSARIKTQEFTWGTLKLMLRHAIKHPTPWKPTHVYG